jgi:cell division protein FtsB
MRNLLAPETFQKTKRITVIAVCGLALLSVGAREIFGSNGYIARRRRRLQIQSLGADIQKLKQENVLLSQRIQDLRSNPQAIEKLAREQLKLARPGDVVITLAPPDNPAK